MMNVSVMYIINTTPHGSALYGIDALVVLVSEILLVRSAHSFDFFNNSCVIPYASTFHKVFSIFLRNVRRTKA